MHQACIPLSREEREPTESHTEQCDINENREYLEGFKN
jgi:hypothetical protein